MLCVLFGSVFVMLSRVQRVPVRRYGMMRALFVRASLVVFCSLAMVLGGMLMMVRGLLVVFVDFVLFVGLTVHRCLPGSSLRWQAQHRRVR